MASSSRPIPAHCDPCPEKTHTSPLSRSGSGDPVTTPSEVSPAASRRSRPVSWSRPLATTAARWPRWARRSARVRPAAASPTGDAARWSASRPACAFSAARRRGRQREQAWFGGFLCLVRPGTRGRALQYDVRDGAAVAEARHGGAARRAVRGPLGGLGDHAQAGLGPGDLGVRLGDERVRRDLPVRERQHRLDHPRRAGSALQVPDVGLDRADQARRVIAPAGPVHRGDRGRLQRVAELRAGAVRLHVVDRAGVHTRVRARTCHHVHLRLLARRHDPVRVPVLVHGTAADDGQDPVAVALGVGEELEDQDAAALAAAIAVGGRVEGLGPAVRRERAGLAQRDCLAGGAQQVDAAGERRGALAEAQALAGQVGGDQRRRAGRVQRDAGAAQVEGVGDAVGDGAGRRADPGPRLDARQVLELAPPVVVGADADEDARVLPGQCGRRDAGVFERLPADLEQHPLLRVHQLGLAR